MTKFLVSFLLLISCGILHAKYSVKIELDKADGIYKSGETVKGTVKVFDDGKAVKNFKGGYYTAFEKRKTDLKTVTANDKALIIEGKSDRPGWLYFCFNLTAADGKAVKGKIRGQAGALFDPEKIVAVGTPPADFQDYWKKCRAELDKVPVKAKLEPIEPPARFKDKIDCWGVTVDCCSREPVTGYLAVPKGSAGKKLPAIVMFLSHVSADASKNQAAAAAMKGAIALYVSWHGLPVNQPKDFYVKKLRSREFNLFQGITNRDTWFFRGMFMRVMRALDYIKSRPEWNGKDLAVKGGSLGGAQTLAAAALDPAVTLAIVGVPAFCDLKGSQAGRENGHPFAGKHGKALMESDDRIPKTASYFDAVNFARMIHCPIYVCTGFIDNICPPSNVFTFYNAISSSAKKHMTTNPYTGHGGTTRDPAAEAALQDFFKTAK
ncbi:MAG: acetylxylan esterase [Victivallales bacterium]|nr:acetylxylan esterase [Victivallales bacterium]